MFWTLTLPADAVDIQVLSLNARAHHLKVAEATRQLRRRVCMEAKVAVLDTHDHIHAVLTYHPPDRRRRDRVNLTRVHKAVIDGLVDAHVIVDDTPAHLTDLMPRIGAPADPAYWLLEIHT